jgi:hippurate hydrolase
MFSEDFAFLLQHVPGAMVFIGNGNSAPLHTPQYDFNDALLPIGVGFFTNLTRLFFSDSL